MERATLKVEEAGRLLGIGRSLAYKAVNDGTLPVCRIGKRILVPRASIEKMLFESELKNNMEVVK